MQSFWLFLGSLIPPEKLKNVIHTGMDVMNLKMDVTDPKHLANINGLGSFDPPPLGPRVLSAKGLQKTDHPSLAGLHDPCILRILC